MAPRISRRTVAVDRAVPAPPTQTQPRRQAATPSDDDDGDGDGDVDILEETQGSGSSSVEQLAKGLVRYALACEFARKPIKRQDVNERVLGSHARLFRAVFEQANSELMDVFGMAMAELPRGDKVTARQKRAAAGLDAQAKTSNMWVLQTVVPAQYRDAEVVGPSRPAGRAEEDAAAAYVGLYSMVIALVLMAGGRLGENKLERALRRMNANQTTPVDTTDKTLALMVKDGYVVKVRESVNGDETVDYIVGPRGKVEVGREGFADLVRTVYGDDEAGEELELKIRRTLDVAGAAGGGGGGGGGGPAGEAPPAGRGRKRGRADGDADEE